MDDMIDLSRRHRRARPTPDPDPEQAGTAPGPVEQLIARIEELNARLATLGQDLDLVIIPIVPQTGQQTLDATGGDRDTQTWTIDTYRAVSIVYDIPADVDATLELNGTNILNVADGAGRSGTWDAPQGTIRVQDITLTATNNAATAQDVGAWIMGVLE